MSKTETEVAIEVKYKDIQTERQILAYSLKKEYVADIEVDWFVLIPHKLVVEVLKKYKTTLSAHIVWTAMSKRLKAGINRDPYKEKIKKIFGVDVSALHKANVTILIDALKVLSIKRKRLSIADDYVKAVLEDREDTVNTIARQLRITNVEDRSKKSGELVEDYLERVEIVKDRKQRKGRVGIPTGVTRLDLISGGLLSKEMGILIGESSLGKSMFLENFGLAGYDEGYNVCHITIEMDKYEIQFRADARLAQVRLMKFRLGDFKETDFKKWKKKMDELYYLRDNFYHVEHMPRRCSPGDVESVMEKCQDKYQKPVHLCIVDYLNIMGEKQSRGNSKDWAAQADVAWGLKEIAADFNSGEGCVLWTGNQIKDEDYNAKELSLTSLKYGRAISEVAPIVLGLVRDDQDKILEQMKIQILKFRGTKKIETIIVRPNFDFAAIKDERQRIKSLEDL